MSSSLTVGENDALEITERFCSILSILGCSFVMITFLSFPTFRKPINRLVFYAIWGNILCNVGSLVSLAGIRAGQYAALCQFQGFLIQLCLPADAMWNLCMAINVYLTVFRKYNAAQLRKLEWIYLTVCYGGTFVVALTYCFISTENSGRIYGNATLWCWIAPKWDGLRVATCYGPAWVCIVTIFTIYFLAGRRILMKKRQLGSSPSTDSVPLENPFTSHGTTEILVTREVNMETNSVAELARQRDVDPTRELASPVFEQYNVTVGRGEVKQWPQQDAAQKPKFQTMEAQYRDVTAEAEAAASGYLKCASLFFVSLLITWVPSSIFRVYSLAHPGSVSWPLAYLAGLVLPLMGFWNSVIYVVTSWGAVTSLFTQLSPRKWSNPMNGIGIRRRRTINSAHCSTHRRRSPVSLSDSMKGFAGGC
ncbi:hypothetical protein MMC19_003216 [Ptychographa xylographoides]|nr:hypothetical protein [Ptychographa xylographoides]